MQVFAVLEMRADASADALRDILETEERYLWGKVVADRVRSDSEGVVVGTSLNGIGKKISMIDHASPSDTQDMIQLASRFYSPLKREPLPNQPRLCPPRR